MTPARGSLWPARRIVSEFDIAIAKLVAERQALPPGASTAPSALGGQPDDLELLLNDHLSDERPASALIPQASAAERVHPCIRTRTSCSAPRPLSVKAREERAVGQSTIPCDLAGPPLGTLAVIRTPEHR